VIDGRVCRLWRQIVLIYPRAWAYLEIDERARPSIGEFSRWLRRSGAAPLHIRVHRILPLPGIMDREFWDLLGDSCTRITSLRMRSARLSFLNGRDFPCMRVLDVKEWVRENISATAFRWGSMPCLRSLRLSRTAGCMELLDSLPPLKMLSLYDTDCTSLTRHSQSLTSLLLQKISWSGPISGPVDFPSLTYLSLHDVCGLKPHINAPCLTTYHEAGSTEMESFSAPLHSLVEYGVWTLFPGDGTDITRLHDSFPNITTIIIHSVADLLMSFVAALARHPHALPVVQTICAEGKLTYKEREVMEGFIRARRQACHMNVTLHFERLPPKIPVFFAKVSQTSCAVVSDFLTYITGSRIPFVTVVESRVCPEMHSTCIRKYRACSDCRNVHSAVMTPVETAGEGNFEAPSWIYRHGRRQRTRLSSFIRCGGVWISILIFSLGIHLASIIIAPLWVCVVLKT
jgi:hypothetical protein